MKITKCNHCEDKFERNHFGRLKMYCSNKCRHGAYYKNNKKLLDDYRREWFKNNPERTYELRKKACNKFIKNNPERFKVLMNRVYQRKKIKENKMKVILKSDS